MTRNQRLLGLASTVLAAAIVVIAIDTEESLLDSTPEVPTPTSEEQTENLLRVFVTQVIEKNLRPRVADFAGTRVLEGTRGTATIRRTEVDGDLTLRIMFDGYVLRLTSARADEYEIRADGSVEYTRSTSGDGSLRIRGDDVRLGRLDINRRNPFIDAAGTFTFDISGSGPDTLMGMVERETGEQLTIAPMPVVD